jgi:serine phosphatase RsbU (regulator of sigma subunit)/pSer/pThr/pTyr-binding forkhead associated (FHA) protein
MRAMFTLKIEVPGEEPRRIPLDKPVTTIGRSSFNDVVLGDKSLSRRHARILKDGEGLSVEDLDSRNGTFFNGEKLTSVRPLGEGDRITIGACTLTVSRSSTTQVQIDPAQQFDPHDSTVFRAEASLLKLQPHYTDPKLPATQLARLVESMRVVNEMTLELIRDVPIGDMLTFLMDKVFETLKPDRGVVLLKRGDVLETSIARTADGIGTDEIRLSQTLVSTVVEKKQGLLVMDAGQMDGVAMAQSIRISGIKSILAAPLENAGVVVGLIYVDSRLGKKTYTEDDLRLLTSLANVAAAKIQNAALTLEAAEKKRMERDFYLAREIQQKLLPDEAPEYPGFELLGANIPSKEVSGDYYDFRQTPDGKLYAVIADVCGKGVGPALLMAWLQATFSAWADESMPISTMVTRISERLAARTAEGRFITAFFLVIDGETGQIEYVNAGHNPPLWVKAGGEIQFLPTHGRPLALFPQPYGSTTITPSPGDLLLLYTDGVTEANNPKEEEFGVERLSAFATARRDDPLEGIGTALFRELDQFAAEVPFGDDRTLVLVRRKA